MKLLRKPFIAALAAGAIGVGVIQACYVQSPYNLCVPPGMTILFLNSTPGFIYDQNTQITSQILNVNYLSTQSASYGPGHQLAKSGSANLVTQCNYNWVPVTLTAWFWDYLYTLNDPPPPPLGLNDNPTFNRADNYWYPETYHYPYITVYGMLPDMWSLPGGINGPMGKIVPIEVNTWGSQVGGRWYHNDDVALWRFPNWGHVYVVCCGQGPDDTSCGPDGGGGGE